MIEPKFIEMMNMELDGVLPERDRAELRNYLSSSPLASEYFEGLRAAMAAVDTVGQVDPPEGLVDRITASVPFASRRVEAPQQGFKGWRHNLFSMPRFRYAAVFVFGLAFGALVFSAIDYDSRHGAGDLEVDDIVGTMTGITTSNELTQRDAFDVAFEEVRGTVTLDGFDRILRTDVALDASVDIEWVIEYDGQELSLDGFRRLDGAPGEVRAGDTRLRVRQSGSAQYALVFSSQRKPVKPLLVKIFSADQLLLEKTLYPAAKSVH